MLLLYLRGPTVTADMTKSKMLSSPVFCSEKLIRTDHSKQDQIYAKKRDTVLQSTSPGKIGRKKVKFFEVIKPRKALDFEASPLQKSDSLLDVSAPKKVSKLPLCDLFLVGSALMAAQKIWTGMSADISSQITFLYLFITFYNFFYNFL